MNELTKQKLEAIIRSEIDNQPYKYRDVRAMYYHGITPYKEWSEQEINEYFDENELEITEQDKEWADYQYN